MASNVPNRGPQLLAVDVAFMTTAAIANALRCFVRIRMVKAFGVDDWLMMCACISFITYGCCSIIGVTHGTGRHHADLSLEQIHTAKHYWWFCYLFYCTSMITSKVSIGWFLLRIAVKRIHAWIIYGAMFISVVAGTVFFFVVLFQCKPISYFWNKTQPGGQCLHIDVIIGLGYLYSVFSIISDFTFAVIPAFLVWNLQLKRRTKMALTPLLTMGCIASCAVIVRLAYIPNFRSPDFLWATFDIAIWSTVEQGLAITAGSLATLRPLIHLVFYKLGLTNNAHTPMRGGASTPTKNRRPSADMLNCFRCDRTAVIELESGLSGPPRYVEKDMAIAVPEPTWQKANLKANLGREPQSSPNWYTTSFAKKMASGLAFGHSENASKDRIAHIESSNNDDGSEKSLKGKSSAGSLERSADSSREGDGHQGREGERGRSGNWNNAMRIMVETRWEVTEGQRNSRFSE